MIAGRISTVALLLLSAATNTIPRWIPGWTIFGRKAYYLGQALSFLLLIIAGKIKNGKDELVNVFYEFLLIIAFSNLTDEMWGDPVNFGLSEKLFGAAAVAWTIYRAIRCQNRPMDPQ